MSILRQPELLILGVIMRGPGALTDVAHFRPRAIPHIHLEYSVAVSTFVTEVIFVELVAHRVTHWTGPFPRIQKDLRNGSVASEFVTLLSEPSHLGPMHGCLPDFHSTFFRLRRGSASLSVADGSALTA